MKKETKFRRSPYLKRYVFQNIKWYLYEIKYAWQRMMYGYSYSDVMDADYWFVNTMANVLEDLKNTTNGYPVTEESFESWKEKLGYIVFCLREADSDTCSKNQNFDDFEFLMPKEYDKLTDKEKMEYNKKKNEILKKEDAIESYRHDMAMIALDLIKENYGKLWD